MVRLHKRHCIGLVVAPAVVPLCIAGFSFVSASSSALAVLGPILGISYAAAAILGLPALVILLRFGTQSLASYCGVGLFVGVATAVLLSAYWGWSSAAGFLQLAATCSLFSSAASLVTWTIAEWCLGSSGHREQGIE